ncbi:ferritin-like domain-containing protein [Mucilaginibacter achroorhodeus]|uniref:Ferritin-like domain-containing protein n=1 Tax=Mucilaginibacter achroorhodeus TaxID=2599294 RepID=A0A563U201_9SPHI|nr:MULTISPECIES: ferritin-like domain-containing protein [Mucilaginibacter]QXV65563.1 ferritin-like domain-containing protein [Mucilaginibacter sp. 21P]TWR25001.1 ferritin-like domain-containing protein [Mucilaginibacter achroorhodeus]
MNIFDIVQEIEKVDPEVYDRLNPRRAAIKNITSFGSKVAVAALPFALGTMFKRAYGQSSSSVVDVLNYALTLEHLEAAFYTQGLATSNLVPAANSTYLGLIKRDEVAHVKFLQTVISSLNATPVSAATYDFTGGNNKGNGPFKDVFSNYATFLAVAQVFEDTGVRAYKGQAGNLLGNQTVLTAALSIHAVEARHASAIRQLRFNLNQSSTTKPYIVSTASLGNDTGVAAANGNYAGEENVTQGGVNLVTALNVSAAVATASFDEPLTKDQVLALVAGSFIVS